MFRKLYRLFWIATHLRKFRNAVNLVPKHTPYCYTVVSCKIRPCPFFAKHHNYLCLYNGSDTCFDMYKTCGIDTGYD